MKSNLVLGLLQAFAENPLPISIPDKYAVIIGSSPSRGARSPILWNRCFELLDIPCMMFPIDVTSSNFSSVMEILQKDSRCIGGAVTMPFKERIVDFLTVDSVNADTAKIGAANIFFRADDGAGLFCGVNTDGEAARLSVQEFAPNGSLKSILQLGCGGVGRSVAISLQDIAPVSVCVRRPESILNWANDNSIDVIKWSVLNNELCASDLIVNTTSVGFDMDPSCPLTGEQLLKLRPQTRVFDVIYKPTLSALLTSAKSRGLSTLNGEKMNMDQAALGFSKCVGDVEFSRVRAAMLSCVFDE